MPLLHQDIFSLGPFLLYSGLCKIHFLVGCEGYQICVRLDSVAPEQLVHVFSQALFQNRFFIDSKILDICVFFPRPSAWASICTCSKHHLHLQWLPHPAYRMQFAHVRRRWQFRSGDQHIQHRAPFFETCASLEQAPAVTHAVM